MLVDRFGNIPRRFFYAHFECVRIGHGIFLSEKVE